MLKLQTTELLRIDNPPRHYFPKRCWKKATNNDINGFKNHMRSKLNLLKQQISILECTNVNCQSLEHRKDIDQYIIDIIKCIEQSSQECIPYTNPRKDTNKSTRKVVPGWTELFKPLCDEAKFWYNVWYSAGKPNSGELHNIMCQTRNRFKYAKRRCHNACERIN